MNTKKKTLFLALTALSSAACSLAFSLDDYEGTAKSGEGGTTGTSSSSGTGTGTSSGSTSGTPDIDAGGQNPDGSFCPTNAVICDDFERTDPANVRGPWDSLNASGAAVTLENGTPTGTALKVHVPAGAGYLTADLQKDIGTIATKATISSRVFFSVDGTSSGLHLNALVFQNGAPGVYSKVFPFLLAASGVTISELKCSPTFDAGCGYAQSTIVPLEQNKWHDLTFTVDFTTKPATLTLIVDGAIAIQANSQLDAQPGPLQAQAAAAYVDYNHGTYDLMIDNVFVSGF